MKKKMKYEEAVNRLEELIVTLEKGELPLEDTVAVFDEATKLYGYCSALLDSAKIKISELAQDGENDDDE